MPKPDKKIAEELKEIIQNLKAPNIAVIGRTGTGKSTLINKIFGVELTKTGAGLPITQGFCRFPTEGSNEVSPVVIYDSPGYEATKEAAWVENVIQFFDKKKRRESRNKFILFGMSSMLHRRGLRSLRKRYLRQLMNIICVPL